MTQFAAETSVPVEKTRTEIERTLARYKADAFGYMVEPGSARIAFRMAGRHYRFLLPLPRRADFLKTATGQLRAEESVDRAIAQAERQRWRALLLIIKAKLEAAAAGITTIEDEFLAHAVLPDGSTLGEWAEPQIAEAYRVGAMPPNLMLQGPR